MVYVNVMDYGAIGDGITDDTSAIQDALDSSLYVYFPEGTYKTSAMLVIRSFQVIRGVGSERSVILNGLSDCFGKDDNYQANGNFIQISGIGCTKDFDVNSRTKAFNLSNMSFIKCDDIAATNFFTAVYLARDSINFDGGQTCWYNAFHRVTATECHTGIHIDDSVSNQSVNGCFFSQLIMSGWAYRWYEADPSMKTSGIRYSGYGHVFRDSYIQGFVRHIWRDRVGGANLLDGIYLESARVPGEVVYAPQRWAGHRDVWSNGHCDGFDLDDNIHDPERVFIINTADEIRNAPIEAAGGFEAGTELMSNGVFDADTLGWTADTAILSSVPGGQDGNALQLAQNTAATGYAYQIIATTPFKRHKLTFYHKNGTFTGRVLVGKGVTGTEFGYIPTLNDANWTKYTLYFTPDQQTTYISFACAGTLQNTLYDQVSVYEVPLSVIGDADVSGDLLVSGVIKVNDLRVVGERQAALPDVAMAATAPTKAEYDTLAQGFNNLLARLRAHGLIQE